MVDAFVTVSFHGAISKLEGSHLRQKREMDVMDRSFPPKVSVRQCWKHELVRQAGPDPVHLWFLAGIRSSTTTSS